MLIKVCLSCFSITFKVVEEINNLFCTQVHEKHLVIAIAV